MRYSSRPEVIVAVGRNGSSRSPTTRRITPCRSKYRCTVSGRIRLTRPEQKTDVDLFRMECKRPKLDHRNRRRRARSPLDTRIEVLHADGKPVERVKRKPSAIRSSISHHRFQPKRRASEKLEEMDLNELLYIGARSINFSACPRAGLWIFAVRPASKRRCFLIPAPPRTPTWTLRILSEPHQPGEHLTAKWLPVFTLYYAKRRRW